MTNEERLTALEASHQRLQDIEAIKQLKAQYLNACDRQDPEAVRGCFAEGEVIIDMSYFGHCPTATNSSMAFSCPGLSRSRLECTTSNSNPGGC